MHHIWPCYAQKLLTEEHRMDCVKLTSFTNKYCVPLITSSILSSKCISIPCKLKNAICHARILQHFLYQICCYSWLFFFFGFSESRMMMPEWKGPSKLFWFISEMLLSILMRKSSGRSDLVTQPSRYGSCLIMLVKMKSLVVRLMHLR